jgi:hypothetical protein
MTGMERSGERSPDELHVEIEELRAELGETVEELARRADVPSRLREKREETAQRVHEQLAHTGRPSPRPRRSCRARCGNALRS